MSTIAKQIEQAVTTLLQNKFAGYDVDVTIRPFVAETGEEDKDVSYPVIEFAVDPFVPDSVDAPFGYCEFRMSVMTYQGDDKFGAMLDDIYEKAYNVLIPANIGPLIMAPWLLCGINNVMDSTVGEDETTQAQMKGRTFSIAVAQVGE
jgi:hypothetical protein